MALHLLLWQQYGKTQIQCYTYRSSILWYITDFFPSSKSFLSSQHFTIDGKPVLLVTNSFVSSIFSLTLPWFVISLRLFLIEFRNGSRPGGAVRLSLIFVQSLSLICSWMGRNTTVSLQITKNFHYKRIFWDLFVDLHWYHNDLYTCLSY